MQEDFLHYIWKHGKFKSTNLKTTEGHSVSVKQLGQYNYNSGPDFFNAHISIHQQLWAGNVEIHLKSSDWYHHGHEKDSAYDNVILHVVWEHDTDIFRKDNSKIPTLQLRDYIDGDLKQKYLRLINSKTWINCESDFPNVDTFSLNNWLERVYFERLEQKAIVIEQLLAKSHNDWEAVLFKLLCKNFGLKVNGEAFLSLSNSFDFSIIRKLQTDVKNLEALFFGQLNLLKTEEQSPYQIELEESYTYIKQKHKLDNKGIIAPKFFRLRPSNFPTIRLAQLAQLYATHNSVFSKVIDLETKTTLYELFDISASEFWSTHYTFSTPSKSLKKTFTKAFIDLIIINTIIPLKFAYAKSQGNYNNETLITLIKSIAIEKNNTVQKFMDLQPIEKTALNSQALLQLKQNYCDKNKCLQCAIGNSLISKK